MTIAPDTLAWHVAERWRERILAGAQLRLDAGSIVVIKRSPHRAVYRASLAGIDVHIKHNRLLGWRSRLREFIRPSKARREYELALELETRGVPTPAPIGWGRLGLESWLITRTSPGVPLIEMISDSGNIAPALGEFIALLHNVGVVHRDLHPGNILVDLEADRPAFTLLDLHAVRLGPPCSWNERRQNLAVFNRFFALRASRSERLRFWKAYSQAASEHVTLTTDRSGRDIERLTDQSNAQFWLARDRRSLATNRYYRRFKEGSLRGHAVHDLDDGRLKTIVITADATLDGGGVRLLKNSRSSTVAEIEVRVGNRIVPAILKRFAVVDRVDPPLGLLRPTPAMRSWVSGHGMLERLLPTARPLAVWHRTANGMPGEGYLLTEKIPDAVELRNWVDQSQTRELRSRIATLGRLIRTMHDRGISQRDLKASNILTAGASGDCRFWFIDLVGISRSLRVSSRHRIQNLARLNASFAVDPRITRTDRLRFLRAYRQWALRGKGGWKTWWRRIEDATLAKQARNARNGRPLA